MKTCNKCKTTKELTEYQNDKRNADGKQGICSSCKNEAKAARRAQRMQNRSYKHADQKKCNKCLSTKPIGEFYKDKAMSDGHASICKSCKSESVYKWREDNKEKYNAAAREWGQKNPEKRYYSEIKRRYGCTLEQYNALLVSQAGKCALCDTLHNPADKKGRLYVDHCHTGGQIRALLCGSCNSGLRYFKDNPELLQKAIAYLKKHAA